jgi:Protein of Unknown function (DUF2784)
MARPRHVGQVFGLIRSRAAAPYIPVVTALIAAVAVVLVHLAYLVYATVGGFLGLRSITWLWPHFVSTMWSVAVTLTSLSCPLTALEKWLLTMSGRTPYEDSFTAHYLRGVLYPPQYEVAIWLGMIGVALLSYVVVLTAPRRRTARSTGVRAGG